MSDRAPKFPPLGDPPEFPTDEEVAVKAKKEKKAKKDKKSKKDKKTKKKEEEKEVVSIQPIPNAPTTADNARGRDPSGLQVPPDLSSATVIPPPLTKAKRVTSFAPPPTLARDPTGVLVPLANPSAPGADNVAGTTTQDHQLEDVPLPPLLRSVTSRQVQGLRNTHHVLVHDDLKTELPSWNPQLRESNVTMDWIKTDDTTEFRINDEVGVLGGAWRGSLYRLMVSKYDTINGLLLSRILQVFLPFSTGFESHLIGQLIEALHDHTQSRSPLQQKLFLRRVLAVCFKNRNVSRAIVTNLTSRYDWIWHLHTWMTYNRFFDGYGQLPLIGFTSFPASENFPATRNHAIASIFRVVLGEGNWITRVLTGGREGLVTDNPNNTAQNLAAESNNFEVANRNQYGNYFGRLKTNEFRYHHRLPTDESLVRTFVTNPVATTVNNGVQHVLRQVARHWHNMLYQEWGNFAHQRMEQLDPFETLRFHVPQLLLVITNLRGRNRWDSDVLGPFLHKLQSLSPSSNANEPIRDAFQLAETLKKDILFHACSGVTAWYEPFDSWVNAILEALRRIEYEAFSVLEIIKSVELGIQVGYECMSRVNWVVPNDGVLKRAILKHVQGQKVKEVTQDRIQSALNLTTPRDKRTFIELVKNGHASSTPAKLLLGRIKTLLQRELRRDAMNKILRQRSIGNVITDDVTKDKWYWIPRNNKLDAYICLKPLGGKRYRFMHLDSNIQTEIDISGVQVREYVHVPESINRAQKAYMNIELEYGRTFKYSAFMEFPFLRTALLRLAVVSQMCCEELDNARVNNLKEVQRSKSRTSVKVSDLIVGETYYVYDRITDAYRPFTHKQGVEIGKGATILSTPPQSTAVIGGGPTGLMTVLHCTENVLASGGIMKLYEARDAFLKGGSTFERGQIVRLDARWISMLRYHLGTIFEDIFISLAGETDAQLGNTLPTQGFVELTIKNLESMLHDEVTRLWSKGLISIYTESKAQYSPLTNSVVKEGAALKKGDLIKRKIDNKGQKREKDYTWRVINLKYTEPLDVKDLDVGKEYGVWSRKEQTIKPCRLTRIDLEVGEYTFKLLDESSESKIFKASGLPSIYPSGTSSKAHGAVTKVVMECINFDLTKMEAPRQETLSMSEIKKEKFVLDVGYTHIVEGIGKPKENHAHLCITTKEPYGVCCMQGLKVSLGMHNFGEKRWGSGILDDIRSSNDQNTRIIGDFTKMVRVAPFIKRMYEVIRDDKNWALHFEKIVTDSKFPQLNEWDPIVPKLREACRKLAEDAPSWRRKTVQTRFFETGDNFYLGMEFTREYDAWKENLGDQLVAALFLRDPKAEKKEVDRLRLTLMHYIDRLWYEGCLEVIRTGDVYNPGARHRVPRLYLINSLIPTRLGSLPVHEAFRLVEAPSELYEIIFKTPTKIVCRNVEGYIKKFSGSEMVKIEGNLTRGPDGNAESKVALATFPVGHYVNHRTMRLSDKKKGYVFAFVGDEQATPHFMRYSGLTGACINAMSFNSFLGKAVEGVDFDTRFREYSEETNWSNGEVVQRGTGSNYGQDGFLRPGFPYREGIDYLHSKVIEYRETGQNVDDILSRDWKNKFAAALIPRGVEHNDVFTIALRNKWHDEVFKRFMEDIEKETFSDSAKEQIRAAGVSRSVGDLSIRDFWSVIDTIAESFDVLKEEHAFICKRVDMICDQLIEFAQGASSRDERVSSELKHQYKPVDSIVDDFAVEAQNFANSLVQSSAFGAGAIAINLLDTTIGSVVAALVGALNIIIAFGTMTNISRYRNRNEEARLHFADNVLAEVEKSVFSLLPDEKKFEARLDANPYYRQLEKAATIMLDHMKYYDIANKDEFELEYNALKKARFSVAAVATFDSIVVKKFLPDTFHVNSYVQEQLVNIHRVCNEIMKFEKTAHYGAEEAEKLYTNMIKFKPRLENSLQRGAIRWGFLKRRKFAHWDITICFRYFLGLFFRKNVVREVGCAPIQVETARLAYALQNISKMNGGGFFSREVIELNTAYWATRESEIASLVFVSAFFVFIASIIFTIGRIFSIIPLIDAATWAAIPSTFGALLAAFHLIRKIFLLLGLLYKLRSKWYTIKDYSKRDLGVLISATRLQILLTLLRLAVALLAAALFPLNIAFMVEFTNLSQLPPLLGGIAILLGIASVLFFFFVEYSVRYSLPTELGVFVCQLFSKEIAETYSTVEVPFNNIDPTRVQELKTWEYTARAFLHEYRFDTVFAADRFGQILQCIQGGALASVQNKLEA